MELLRELGNLDELRRRADAGDWYDHGPGPTDLADQAEAMQKLLCNCSGHGPLRERADVPDRFVPDSAR